MYQGCQMVSFLTKNPDLGKFCEGLWLENVATFYGHLEYFADIWDYFMTIWYILCSFVIFFPVLVPCTKKNLATLVCTS
jgi:hypothetical protein